MHLNCRRLALGVWLFISPALSLATNGYFSHGYGTQSKAMAGVGAALALDSLAPLTNPAASAHLDTRLDGGIALFFPDRGFTANDDAMTPPFASVAPGRYKSDHDLFLIPHFGYNFRIDEMQSVGVSLAANGGLNTDYDDPVFMNFGPPQPSPFAARGQTLTDMAQMVLGFTYARQLDAHHAIGITPIFALQRVRIEGLQPFAAVSVDPDHVTDRGYDYSYGGGVRLGWQGHFLDERLSFGASYQSRVWMSRFDEYRGLFAEYGDFDIPPNYTLGVAFKPLPRLTLAFDIQRILYEEVDALGNRNDFPVAPGALGGNDGLGFGWKDITIGKLGASYAFTDSFVLRAGYSKAESVIPDTQALFNILAPATVDEHITAGFTQRLGERGELNFSFMYAPESRFPP